MTVDEWLRLATADAERRGLASIKPILESIARATRVLRDARLGTDASGRDQPDD